MVKQFLYISDIIVGLKKLDIKCAVLCVAVVLFCNVRFKGCFFYCPLQAVFMHVVPSERDIIQLIFGQPLILVIKLFLLFNNECLSVLAHNQYF